MKPWRNSAEGLVIAKNDILPNFGDLANSSSREFQ
jgi:hypothetical protein